jgi:ABC-type Fe3+-hydroxamate transport system substrate-binding protein
VARRILVAVLALSSFAVLAAGCSERSEPTGSLPAPYPVTVRGAADDPLQLGSPPQRIVALDAGSAELVDALGAGDRLVGVPAGVTLREDSDPQEVVRPTGQVDVGAVARLRPDLVVATPDTDRVEVAQVERRTEAPVYIQPSRSVEDVQRAVIELGHLVGEPVAARQLAGSLKESLAEVEQRVAGSSPVTAFVDRGFLITVSDDTLLGDLVRRARGTNIAAGKAELGPFPAADLEAQNPDVYLATSDSGVTLESLQRDPDTRDLGAVQNGRVAVLPVDLVTHAGPRVAEALEAVALALHPDAFR